MKIISYNINGIRAANKLNILKWLEDQNADVICLQEVRADKCICEEILKGLVDYHIIYNCAEKKGYAGTIILSKMNPSNIKLGLLNEEKDSEGRTIVAFFDDLIIINSYIPNGSQRLEYKKEFIGNLIETIDYLNQSGKKIILCCDANVAHKEIDVNKPKATSKKSGFLLEERKLIDKLLAKGFIDSFRILNPTKIQYTWRSYRARNENNDFGWRFRFDYIFCNKELQSKIKQCYSIDLEYSDHLPVIMEVDYKL